MSYIQRLFLSNFRNHQSSLFEFDPAVTLVIGDNAQGKTAIIEALALLATGNSFRAEKVEEMITFGAELGRAKGLLSDETELEVLLTRGLVQGKKTQSRLYSVNNVRRRKIDFIGKLQVVAFRPEDMRLIEGSPGRRREFLDTALCLVDRGYAQSLSVYEQALKRRNRLLSQVKDGLAPATTLTYWNLQLLKHGQRLQDTRLKFLNSFSSVDFPVPFSVEYQPSLMTEARQQEYASREIAAGHTLIGPHKDDIAVMLSGWPTAALSATHSSLPEVWPVATYGSRGQQRLGVIWLKMCELMYLENVGGTRPILLLDDVLSELDESVRSLVLELANRQQTIVTTTEPEVAERVLQHYPGAKNIHLPLPTATTAKT